TEQEAEAEDAAPDRRDHPHGKLPLEREEGVAEVHSPGEQPRNPDRDRQAEDESGAGLAEPVAGGEGLAHRAGSFGRRSQAATGGTIVQARVVSVIAMNIAVAGPAHCHSRTRPRIRPARPVQPAAGMGRRASFCCGEAKYRASAATSTVSMPETANITSFSRMPSV